MEVKIKYLLGLLLCVTVGLSAQLPSAPADSLSRVFELGEVQVVGRKDQPFSLVIGAEKLASHPERDVSQALSTLPGLNFVYLGQKNDAMVNVRGFDLRQVPVYIDGVPVYVSYDGYADLGRFLVSDLSRISVSRAETSLLLGPNALGGAINLVSRKPVSKLEMDAASALILDGRGYGGLQSELNVGSKKQKYYFQAGIAFVDSKPFILSSRNNQYTSENRLRMNSQNRDLNSSFKFGLTPNPTDSYVFSYYYQDGSKGVPAYVGNDPNQRVRYWQFPEISKQGVHFNSKTAMGSTAYIQTRFYYDDYYSDLRSYDDSTFSTQNRRSSFTSIYDDETLGGTIVISMQPASRHQVKTAFHAIYDHHREHNIYPVEEPVRNFKDFTISMGIEDQIALTRQLHLTAGLGVHMKNNLQADNYDSQSDSISAFPGHRDQSLNLLTGLQYVPVENHHLSFNLSRKNRFPTMKDRYSYRLGQSIPNPDLISEASWNMDLNYAFIPGSNLQLKTSLFYSHLEDAIQAVYGVDSNNSAIYQYQNTGTARFFGWEADLSWQPLKEMNAALQYTLTQRENLSNPELLFTDVPLHKVYGALDYTLFSSLLLQVGGLYNSPRISTSSGGYETEAFISLNLKVAYTILEVLTFEASVSNLLDADYSYLEGYPAPGRQIRLGFRYRMHPMNF
jgi:iron complex outermembrane receptor protein